MTIGITSTNAAAVADTGTDSQRCMECALDYALDKNEMLETCVRRINNVLTVSQNSSEATEAQSKNIRSIRGFETRWKGKRCPHFPDEDQIIADHGLANHEDQVKMTEAGGNVGLNTIPERAFTETVRPRQGSSGGRPPAGVASGSRGTGAAAGKGNAGSGRKR